MKAAIAIEVGSSFTKKAQIFRAIQKDPLHSSQTKFYMKNTLIMH